MNQDLVLKTGNRYKRHLNTAVRRSTPVNSRLARRSQINTFLFLFICQRYGSLLRHLGVFESLPESIKSRPLSGLNSFGSWIQIRGSWAFTRPKIPQRCRTEQTNRIKHCTTKHMNLSTSDLKLWVKTRRYDLNVNTGTWRSSSKPVIMVRNQFILIMSWLISVTHVWIKKKQSRSFEHRLSFAQLNWNTGDKELVSV